LWTKQTNRVSRKDVQVPLSGLVDEIAQLGRSKRRTPVLVTPGYLSLRPPFFVELTGELLKRNEAIPSVRIDWLCNVSLIRQRLARFHARRIQAAIDRDPATAGRVEMVVAASIGQRRDCEDSLVLGLSDEHQDLPPWAQTIQLSGLIRHPTLQLS
tara:strand:- start:165269 stop:165736 length:468 start_codon:yes stop_codon:yes gene_type:complete